MEGRTPVSLQPMPNAMLVYWLPWKPFCLSRGNLRPCDFFCALSDQVKYLPSNVAFETTDPLCSSHLMFPMSSEVLINFSLL